MSGIAAAIGLSESWPENITGSDEMDVTGLFTWASAYFTAAEQLHFSLHTGVSSPFYCGPVMQNVGLATELTLKTMLRGNGKSIREITRHGHNTYNSYLGSRECFDEGNSLVCTSRIQHISLLLTRFAAGCSRKVKQMPIRAGGFILTTCGFWMVFMIGHIAAATSHQAREYCRIRKSY